MKSLMKKFIVGLLFLPMLAVAAPVASSPAANNNNNQTTYLFIQTARKAILEEDKNHPGVYKLELINLPGQVEYFADRPKRTTGMIPVQAFVKDWEKGPHSFKDYPPNVGVTAVHDHFIVDNKFVRFTLELSNPVYNPDKNTMVYTGRVLAGEKAPPEKNMKFRDIALFIDGAMFCASCSSNGF